MQDFAEIATLERASRGLKVVEIHCSNLSKDILLKLLTQRMPFIIREYAKSWTCVEKWRNIGYMKQLASIESTTHPHRSYQQFFGSRDDGGKLHLTDGRSKRKFVRMEEFLEVDGAHTSAYLLGIHEKRTYCPVQTHKDDDGFVPPFAKDVPEAIELLQWYSEIFAEKHSGEHVSVDHQQFFLAKGYAFTNMHYDSYHNFYFAITGTRKWTLAAPNASRWLKDSRSGPFSNCSACVPHRDLYPPGSLASIYPFVTISLDPGDVLHVPACWWHLVESIPGDNGLSCAINFLFSHHSDAVFEKMDEEARELEELWQIYRSQLHREREFYDALREIWANMCISTYEKKIITSIVLD